METPRNAGRDPVCESIESLLRELEGEGKGELQITDDKGSVRLSFGSVRVEAPTIDIALVRLANAMIDDPRYSKILYDLLRGPMQAAS